jgi:hypothetical protein
MLSYYKYHLRVFYGIEFLCVEGEIGIQIGNFKWVLFRIQEAHSAIHTLVGDLLIEIIFKF